MKHEYIETFKAFKTIYQKQLSALKAHEKNVIQTNTEPSKNYIANPKNPSS